LVEVPHQDRIIRQVGEQLLAHLPTPPRILVPCHAALVMTIGRLLVVAAEEGLTTEDDVLRVNPVFGVGINFIAEYIPQG
jgi:hypothetical protein